MLGGVDRKFSKSFIGDSIFDIERERTRCPLFLNRNMRRVLDHHAKMQRTRSSAGIGQNTLFRRSSETSLVTPPPRSTRLRDQLIEKFHQEDAELIFDIRSIRRKLNYRENLDERPRKRIRRETVECKCYFAVWDNRQGHRQLEPILKRCEDCRVTPADTASDAHAAEIELERPFRIPAREFFVPVTSRDGEISRWEIGDKYLLEIKIIPCNTSDLWPPMPILSKSDDSLARGLVKRKDLAFTEGMLVSNYTNLPHTPPADVPLNVAFDQCGRTFKTKYGLEVNAEWTYPHIYDAKIKKEDGILIQRVEEEEKNDPLCRSIDRSSLARSRKSRQKRQEVSSPVKQNVQVSYAWDIETRTPLARESRTTSLEGLYCPVCHAQEFASLERLQFHFCNIHDKYKFIIEGMEDDPATNKLKSVRFRIEVAEIVRPRAANHVKDEREFSWQRPKRPFDIEAYISGETSWTGALPRRRTVGTAQAQQGSGTATPSALPLDRKHTFRPAAEVREIPLLVRKKFEVPAAKTRKETSFYRSISHKVMKTGEMLSETDDEIDNDWLVKKQNDAIAETEEWTAAEKNFRQRWNMHIMSEGCPSARYVSDSLIRFVRKNANWLKDMDMLDQFHDLTATLMERGLMDAKILKDCLRIVQEEDLKGKAVETTTANPSDVLLQPATEISTSSEGSNLPNAYFQPSIRDGNDQLGSGAPSHQNTNGINHVGPLEMRQDEAKDPRTLSEPKPSPVIANGFCGICDKYIFRPKRNAVTCSNPVSLLESVSFVFALSF